MRSEVKIINTQPDEDGDLWFIFPPTPYKISTNNTIDLSYLNQNSHSRIIIKEGHFYDLRTNKQIRFFGTNVVGADAFPSKDDSPLLAKRMSQLGINLVRFHHMDHHDIWLDHTNSILNPEKLDLLHYFLFCLHRNGIYANINLHVTREYPEKEYSKAPSEFKQLFRFGKCLDRFYQPFINDQIQYSIDLLNSFNKYTKCKLGDDPMILNVELNNENSMVDLFHPIKMNAIKGTVFEIELKNQWKKWLHNKYRSFDNVLSSWNPKNEQIDRSIDLLNDLKHGYQKDKSTEVKIDKNNDRPSFEFIINQIPQFTWSNQIHFYSFPLETNSIYTIEFEAKAVQNSESTEKLTATVMFEENKPPWKIYSIKNKVVDLTDQFQKFSVVLTSASSLETEDKSATMICKIIICPKIGVYTFKNIKAFHGKEINNCWSKEQRKKQISELIELKFNPNEGIYGELLNSLKKGYQKDTNTVINIDKKDEDYPSYEFSINQIPQYTWSNQIHFYSFPLKADTTYTIEFEAKAVQNSESTEKLTATAMFEENKPPWKIYSIKNKVVELTDQFQKFSFHLTSAASLETEDKTATMMFKIIICPKIGVYTFKNIKAFYGIIEHTKEEIKEVEEEEEELNEDEREHNIEDILLPDALTFPEQANRDFRLFINDVETSTQQKILTFIKNTFSKSRILIVDSQAVYGNMFSYEREYENSDFIDNHAYWQHPIFDKGFTWHKDHYSIKNTSMFSSTSFGTFANLTMFKPYGKPYTISEYNHAFPNEHIHEKFPMFGSWAAFHDWDAIYQFAFGQVSRDTDYFVDYFSMARNPIDISFAPFIALAFRKFYVSKSDKYVHLKIPKSFILKQNEKNRILSREVIQPYYAGWPSQFDVEIINDDQQKMDEIKIETNIDINEQGQFITEEIIWKDTYQVKTPKMKTITGMIGDTNKSIENDLGLLKIKMKLNEKLNESATVGIVSLDDKELEKSTKILLVIAGKTKNTNQKWNKDRTSTGRVDEGCNWGCAPVLVQFIEFEAVLNLPEKEKPEIWTINEFCEKNKSLELEKLEIKDDINRWLFKSDYSKPSLSFLIERKL